MEFEKPGDMKAKKAIHVEYPLNYKKQVEIADSGINKENKAKEDNAENDLK